MKFPTAADYQSAIQHPQEAFSDPELQAATPDAGPFGLPKAISGAYAVVFSVTAPTGKHAVRCWLSDSRRQAQRYRHFEHFVGRNAVAGLVPCHFQDQGVLVHDRWWPLVKMGWVEGPLLNRFIEANLGSPETLHRLAEKWRALVSSLAGADIIHGDLQHGNVIVRKADGDVGLHLVDYDNIRLPGLKGAAAAEVGHRNYQHPDVAGGGSDANIDRFPAALVYTAILGCAHAPELWHRYDNGENLLFRSDDFYEPGASRLFADLREIAAVRPYAESLRRLCDAPAAEVPALDEFVAHPPRKPFPIRAPRKRDERYSKPEMDARERRFAPICVAGVLTAAAVGIASDTAVGFALFAVFAALMLLFARRLYDERIDRKRAVRLRKEIAFFNSLIRRLEDELSEIFGKEQTVIEEREERKNRRLAELREKALYDRLKYHFIAEAEAFEGLDHRVIVCLKGNAVRTAYHAAPERVNEITRLSPESKARVNLWRASLVSRYREELPDTLPVGEERRLERLERARLEEIRTEIERIETRLAFQRDERASLRKRLQELPAVSFRRYLPFLLRLTPGRDLFRRPGPE